MRRAVWAALILLASLPAYSNSLPAVDQTALALAQAAQKLPPEEKLQTTRAALSIVLLSQFNRLLPASLDNPAIEELARVFLDSNPDPARQEAFAKRLPPADSLVFDGTRLVGGNFRNIDAMLGMDARPVALDRDLPTWIVPLTPAAAKALEGQREKFQSNPANAATLNLANKIYQANVGEKLAADGIFLRPYAGRIDDLYHHLAQQGNDSTGLDFPALLDSLPPRQYSPVSGTASRVSVPASRFNLSDVLSGGSFYAIQKFRSENPKVSVKNPFKGLAARLLPYLGNSLHATDAGTPLRISGEMMRRAISDPRRFTPGKVPPLFHDPSRFLGQWDDPRFLRVSKKKKTSASRELLDEIQKIDFETPLPEMNLDPAGNELLGSDAPPDILEIPEDSAEENTADLMRDLGLPDEAEPPQRIVARTPPPQPTPTPQIFSANFKPAPPVLEDNANPSQNPPPLEIALVEPTPQPTPQPTPEPTPTPTEEPTPVLVEAPKTTPPPPPPKPLLPSAVATIEAKDQATPPPPTALPTPEVAKDSSLPSPSSDPNEPITVAKAIAVEPPSDIPSETLDEPAATTESHFQVAALTPTTTEAVQYLKTISASDTALAENMAEFNRAECYIRWIGEAVKPFATVLAKDAESEESQKLEETIRQALTEVMSLKSRRDELKAARLRELEARHAARQALEKAIQTTRRDQLARLTGVGA